MDRIRAAKAKGVIPHLDAMPKSLEKYKWNKRKMIEKIQQKIVERTKRASDQYREGTHRTTAPSLPSVNQVYSPFVPLPLLHPSLPPLTSAYKFFGSPADGITAKEFKWHLQKLGFVLSDAEVQDLFDELDSDGKAHCQAFLAAIALNLHDVAFGWRLLQGPV